MSELDDLPFCCFEFADGSSGHWRIEDCNFEPFGFAFATDGGYVELKPGVVPDAEPDA